jgi:hypothetical protein
MTRDDDFIGQLEGYLEEHEGSTPLPDDVRDALRAQVPLTQQRPAWWPARRLRVMNNTVRIVLAAAAVVVIAFLGIRFLGLGSNVGGPDATPSPTPIPEAFPNQRILSPGSYVIDDPFPVRITLDVPEGWFAWISNADVAGLIVDHGEDSGSGWGPSFWVVENVYADTCDPVESMTPPLGSSVDDLVTALTGLPGFTATAPTEVTVSGFSGVEFELTAPGDGEQGVCPDHPTWTTAGSEPRVMQHGETNRIQILDVDGVRLVIAIVEYAHTTEIEQAAGIPFDANAHVADQPELRQILDSVRIESQP